MPLPPIPPLDITPRNIVWVNDMPPAFTQFDRSRLSGSFYTHAIVCFFALQSGPTLVYNSNDPSAPEYKDWWPYLQFLRHQPNRSKVLIMGVGGWISNTWGFSAGHEAKAAELIVDFAEKQGFDGIDFNFEGSWPVKREHLATMAKMAVELRKIWGGIFTITPIYDEVQDQIAAIKAASGLANLNGFLSWVNVQFYKYNGPTPLPVSNVSSRYDQMLSSTGLPAKMVTAGFPLSLDLNNGSAWNVNELQTALGAVQSIHANHPDFAGLFVWRYRAAFRPETLNWAVSMDELLFGR